VLHVRHWRLHIAPVALHANQPIVAPVQGVHDVEGIGHCVAARDAVVIKERHVRGGRLEGQLEAPKVLELGVPANELDLGSAELARHCQQGCSMRGGEGGHPHLHWRVRLRQQRHNHALQKGHPAVGAHNGCPGEGPSLQAIPPQGVGTGAGHDVSVGLLQDARVGGLRAALVAPGKALMGRGHCHWAGGAHQAPVAG
jgi:hypothetical protein